MALNRNPSIEFIVRPKQDLYLEGSLRRLPRVSKGEAYPCQMQKNQNFSCLFRHYAKHNGLRKEDLVFSFVDELQADQSPESVHLMPQDEIFVEHRAIGEIEKKMEPETKFYSDSFRVLLESGEHSDITFKIGGDLIKAHKAIISARCEYFQAMFRRGGMAESSQAEIAMDHDVLSFKRLLEFIYTNCVRNIVACEADEITKLLILSNEFLLPDLRELCERAACKHISMDNLGKLFLLSSNHNASILRNACAMFVQENREQVVNSNSFRLEVEASPELGLLFFESSMPKATVVDCSQDCKPDAKRRRVTDNVADNEIEQGVTTINENTNTIQTNNSNVQDY